MGVLKDLLDRDENEPQGYLELMLDNVVGLDNNRTSAGEALGQKINEDELQFLKDTGMGIYEGAKEFVQNPIETTKEVVTDVATSVKDLFTKNEEERLQEMFGVDSSEATPEQINQMREGRFGDFLNTASLVPVAGGAFKAGKSLASVLPELEINPNTVGMNLGNVQFKKDKLDDADLNDENLDTLAEELMSVEAFKASGMGNNGSPPLNSVKGYKLFRINRETGELFPLYVDAKTAIPMDTWVPAIAGDLTKSGKVKSEIGELAYRPGFHAAQLPWVNHIGSKFEITKEKFDELKASGANNLIQENTKSGTKYYERLRDDDTVWAEVEMPNDVDWQSEANARARIKKDGTPEAKTAHITDQIPVGGTYLYNTKAGNPNQWLIGGSMKINRVLDDAEVERINQEAGVLGSDMPRTPYSQNNKVPATVEQQTDELLDTSRRVDTRLPTDPKGGEVDLVGTGTLITDTEALMKGNSKMAENFAMMTQSYPGLRNLWSEDVTETAQNIVSRMTDNIVSLYDMSERLGIAKDSANWYRGANRIALGLADRFGLEDTKTAGVLAALSPGKDWFQNVAMGERLIKHNAELGPNAPWTAEMDAVSTTVKASSGKKATTSWQDQPEFETVRGRPWGEMETPLQKAMWIRAYDEAHFGSNFREVNPNGDILGVVVTKSGSPSTLVHQSFTNMAKAIRILDGDGSLDSISPELGKAYKVRNFFNNILNPDSPKDVTVDTHQIAAGLFRPLGQSANEVNQGLVGASVKGNPNKFSNVGQPLTGMKGSYGLYFDGTTEAAKLRNVLPREMQSVSWEQLRTLFPKTLKSNKAFVTNVDAIWRMVDDGSLDPEGAREMIIAEAEKMGAGGVPSWKDYIGEKRDVGIATAGLIGAAGLATADEAEEEEGFASPQ
tara:strand:- start:373 stop:3069 length:2697 start_codon:yes stop_codon:yes gene_type:complete